MALRVLGYKTVVEAKGTWPTNYIAKAEELDLLDDVTYGTYATGAARGNVALIIWNMLRLPMWDVSAESEGDGLMYEESTTSMLNKKFKDYRYFVTEFEGASIAAEGVVEVDLLADGYTNLEYAKNDFYSFVPGSEVEVLVNIKDDTLLSMVETDEYKYIAGGKVDIDEEYDEASKNDFLTDEDYHYAYALVDGKKVDEMTKLVVDSAYVYELDDSSTKRLKVNGTTTLNYETFEDKVVLKDGERATVKDLEVGDVWSTITVSYTDGTTGFTFYMISGAEAEGKLTKLVPEEFENGADNDADYYVATIGGAEYPVAANAVYFVDAEKVEDGKEIDLLSANESTFKSMKNEEVTFVVDFLGRVTAVMFDGKLNAGDEAASADESKFFALTSGVERDGSTYTITVENEDGEQELTFAKGKGNAAWKNEDELAGYFVIMTLNDDDEIETLSGDYSGENVLALRADMSGDAADKDMILYYNEDGDFYTVSGEASLTFDENKLVDSSKNTIARVNDDTVVVTLVFDDKGNEKASDDEYRVEFAGIEAIEKMKNDPAVIITDNGASNFARAKYVVIFDEVSSREDDLVGIVKEVVTNKLGDTVITVVEDRDDEAKDGTEYILNGSISSTAQWIVYSIEENKDGEWELTVTTELTDAQLVSGETGHAYIAESNSDENSNVSDDGREAVITGWTSSKIDLDDEDTKELFEDARIFIVNVVLDEDESATQYFVDNYTEVEYADVELKELDRISAFQVNGDYEGLVIIRGMEAR